MSDILIVLRKREGENVMSSTSFENLDETMNPKSKPNLLHDNEDIQS